MFILIVHVDEILIQVPEEEIKCLHRLAANEFWWVTLQKEMIQLYLGMKIKFAKDGVWIDM